MKDIKQFLSTTAGKVIAIVLVLGIGLLIGSRGATHKNEPVAETPTETQVAVADSTSTAPVAQTETAPVQKTTATPKKTAPVAPTPTPVAQPTPAPAPEPVEQKYTRINGLVGIDALMAIQESWDVDAEMDGPVIDIVYKDSNGDSISSDATAKMPITADVKLYAGTSPMGKTPKLVYSGHFESNQIVYGITHPRIRIPEEQIQVDRSSDYYVGSGVITIHTPEQGDFSDTDPFVQLYEK